MSEDKAEKETRVERAASEGSQKFADEKAAELRERFGKHPNDVELNTVKVGKRDKKTGDFVFVEFLRPKVLTIAGANLLAGGKSAELFRMVSETFWNEARVDVYARVSREIAGPEKQIMSQARKMAAQGLFGGNLDKCANAVRKLYSAGALEGAE